MEWESLMTTTRVLSQLDKQPRSGLKATTFVFRDKEYKKPTLVKHGREEITDETTIISPEHQAIQLGWPKWIGTLVAEINDHSDDIKYNIKTKKLEKTKERTRLAIKNWRACRKADWSTLDTKAFLGWLDDFIQLKQIDEYHYRTRSIDQKINKHIQSVENYHGIVLPIYKTILDKALSMTKEKF